MVDSARPRRRIIRKFTIDYITGADATYSGHQLVSPAFGQRIDDLVKRGRKITYREAESAFELIADEYRQIVGERREGERVRGRNSWKRRRADAFIYAHIEYVRNRVPPGLCLDVTSAEGNSLTQAMAHAFDREVSELLHAWRRRASRNKRAPRLVSD